MQIELKISKQKFVLLIAFLLISAITSVYTFINPDNSTHTLFVDDSCPHCEATITYIDELKFSDKVKITIKNIDKSGRSKKDFEEAVSHCEFKDDEIGIPLLYTENKCVKGTSQILQKLEELSVSS